ncbi:MAG: anthranilate synthase component I family protein [Humibacter sp.]
MDVTSSSGESLAMPGAHAPARRERLPFGVDPELVFDALFAGESHAFWLDARIRDGGVSRLGAASQVRPSYVVSEGVAREVVDGRALDTAVDLTRVIRDAVAAADTSVAGSPLGWVGWFGYEHGARALGVPASDSPWPDVALIAADRVVEFDHGSDELSLWFVDDEEGRAWATATRNLLASLAAQPSAEDAAFPTAEANGAGTATRPQPASPVWRHSDADYLRMIERCQLAIRSGDAYQLCLTNAIRVQTDARPLDVYRRLRRDSPAPYGGFVRFGDISLLSSSPELFLRVADGVAVTSPVKGTARRLPDAVDDARLRDALGRDEKERAENLMIVDLMRNDLSRVARLGGVVVTTLLEVETHRHVHQLVSTVEAQLADGIDALNVLDACFPAGSMTGAPKLSAMGILHGLEKGPRGIYSGCFGWLGLDGSADLAMVIRSIVMQDGEAAIGTGGGITALSVPERELAEIKLKAAALLAALDA